MYIDILTYANLFLLWQEADGTTSYRNNPTSFYSVWRQHGTSTYKHDPDSSSVTSMGTTSHQYNPTSFYSDYRYHGILTYKHNLSSFYRGLHCTKSYQSTKSKFFNDDLHDTTCYQYYQTSFYSEKNTMKHLPINTIQANFSDLQTKPKIIFSVLHGTTS